MLERAFFARAGSRSKTQPAHLGPDTKSAARYADWMETALYNGILAGLSLDGTHYFYQNPLANDGTHRRTEWFSTACCPPNIARLLMSLPGYVATLSDSAFWLHHYAPGELCIESGESEVHARIETDYPWDGRVRLELTQLSRESVPATLHLRIPGWCEGATVRINGDPVNLPNVPGTYTALTRTWRAGDTVELNLPLTPRRITSHPRVEANAGRVALARGPLVYCVEGIDHPAVDLASVALPPDAEITARRREDGALGSIVTLNTESLTAIPYYAWANRASGQMHVWLRGTMAAL